MNNLILGMCMSLQIFWDVYIPAKLGNECF